MNQIKTRNDLVSHVQSSNPAIPVLDILYGGLIDEWEVYDPIADVWLLVAVSASSPEFAYFHFSAADSV